MRWAILALLFAARVGLGFHFQTLGSVADPLVRDLHLNFAEIGTLIGLFNATGLVLSIPAGLAGRYASDRTAGRARTLRRWSPPACSPSSPTASACSPLARLLAGAGFVVEHALLHQDGRRLVRRPRACDGDGDPGDELAVRHRHGPGRPRLAGRDAGLARAVRGGLALLPRGRGPGARLLSPATASCGRHCAAVAPADAARVDTDPDRVAGLGGVQCGLHRLFELRAARADRGRTGTARSRLDHQPGQLGDDLLRRGLRPARRPDWDAPT